MDSWPRGLRRSPGKRVGGKPSRGFDSPTVRHFLPPQRNCLKTHYVFPQDQKCNLISELNRLILNPLNLQISEVYNQFVIEEKVGDSLDLAAAEQIALEFEKAVQANREINGYRILPAGDSLTVQRVKVIG